MLADKDRLITFPCYVCGYVSLYGNANLDVVHRFGKEFNTIIDELHNIQINSSLSAYDPDAIREMLKEIAPDTQSGYIEIFFPSGSQMVERFVHDEITQSWKHQTMPWDESRFVDVTNKDKEGEYPHAK